MSSPQPPRADIAATVKPPVHAPTVGADERRWREIKDSDRLADFYAFQLEFEKSPRRRDAAVRIAELEGAQKSALPAEAPARPKAAESKARPATEKDANRITQADSAARPPAAAGAAKAVVRIRVRPFGYVYVDGVLIGASPPVQPVEVGPGRHKIEARNPEARPSVVSEEIDVSGTQPRDIQLRFGE